MVIADRVAEEAQIQETARVYVKCLQTLLMAQSEALSSLFKQPDLIPLIRHLWLEYLPITGILRLDHKQMMLTNKEIRDVRRTIAAARAGRESSSEEAGEGAAEDRVRDEMYDQDLGGNMNVDGSGSPKVSRKASGSHELLAGEATHRSRVKTVFNRHLKVSATLSICFVACLILRLPVTPMDLQKLIIQGKLPFYDMNSRCQDILRTIQPIHTPTHDLMNPSFLPEPNELIFAAIYITGALQRPLPNVNGEGLIDKCCSDLHLPVGITWIARELYRLYFIDLEIMNLSSVSNNSSPYVTIASIVCISLQLGYGIGQEDEGVGAGSRLPALPDPPKSWIEWAENQMASDSCQALPSMPLDASDVYQETTAGSLSQYISFCHRHMLTSGSTCHLQLREVQAALRKIGRPMDDLQPLASRSAAVPVAGAGSKRSRGDDEGTREDEEAKREAWESLVARSHDVLPLLLKSKVDGRSCHIESFEALSGPRSSSMSADLIALVAVAACWSNTTPIIVIQAVATIQKQMAAVDKAAQDLQSQLRKARGVKITSIGVIHSSELSRHLL